jgi:hypothetical protein
MKKARKIINLTENKAEIEIPSFKEVFRVPIDIFNKFSNKKVKITIEVKE